jgi:quinol monooxygenase YgiN
MSFIFMVLHWPEPGHRDALAQSMREMREMLSGLPGCTAVEPPYLTDDGTCLVGISKWESRQAFLASGITPRPPDEIVEGETRPRQRFFLQEAEPGTLPGAAGRTG